MTSTQITFDGEEAPERKRPHTLIYCEQCDGSILRSERLSHEHMIEEVKPIHKVESQMRVRELEDKLPTDALESDTATYTVTFYYELREVISVEASHKQEAKRLAEERQTYDGEVTHTLHTETSSGSESSPSVSYLETLGLLPDDHDVTQADIDAYIELKEANR